METKVIERRAIETKTMEKRKGLENRQITFKDTPEQILVKGDIIHEISDYFNFKGNISQNFNQMFHKDSVYPDIVLDKKIKMWIIKIFLNILFIVLWIN